MFLTYLLYIIYYNSNKDNNDGFRNNLLLNNISSQIKLNSTIISSIFDHIVPNIISLFDFATGRPKGCQEVIKWPLISIKFRKIDNNFDFTNILSRIITLPSMIIFITICSI